MTGTYIKKQKRKGFKATFAQKDKMVPDFGMSHIASGT